MSEWLIHGDTVCLSASERKSTYDITNHGCASYDIHDAVSYLGSLERSTFCGHGRQAIQRDIMVVVALARGDGRGARCLVEATAWQERAEQQAQH